MRRLGSGEGVAAKVLCNGRRVGEGVGGANKAFRESLRTLIDAISSDASKLHTFLAQVFLAIILRRWRIFQLGFFFILLGSLSGTVLS